uniref:Uncharacterized protein n=1 Tax=Arundo donax TaxID=35708 RepID=A0A0A8ZA10_ARUDO
MVDKSLAEHPNGFKLQKVLDQFFRDVDTTTRIDSINHIIILACGIIPC